MSPKVNIIVRLEFKHAYDIAVQHTSLYVTGPAKSNDCLGQMERENERTPSIYIAEAQQG